MRIALVATGGFDRSGRERVIPALLWLVERLAHRHDVHVFVLQYHDAPCTYSLLGATIHDLGRPRGPIRQARALIHAMRGVGSLDVVHGYWATPAGVAAACAARRLGVASVVTLDSGELVSLPEFGYGLQRTWRGRTSVRLACRLATIVTVCSESMRTRARARGIDPRVIPFGVDRRWFESAAPRAEGPPWRLLQVASLNRVKDHTTLLQAVSRLRARGRDVRLDLVGEDTLGGELQRIASGLGFGEAVTCHGFQPTDRLRACYERAHLYVQSSRHEAAGVAVLEAAVAGVPIVGTRVGYVADFAPARAVSVPAGDPDALGGAIDALLGDPSRRARLAEAAGRWAIEHDADWTAAELERLYERTRFR